MSHSDSKNENHSNERMISIDKATKALLMFGAFFLNHLYLDIFMTVKKADSVLLNTITSVVYILKTFQHSG